MSDEAGTPADADKIRAALGVARRLSDGLLNPGRDASPELTKALDAPATFEVGSPQYEAALQEATKLATEQSANIMLFTEPFLLAHSSAVTGLKPWIETPRLEGVRLSE